jgi:hypothetical protein
MISKAKKSFRVCTPGRTSFLVQKEGIPMIKRQKLALAANLAAAVAMFNDILEKIESFETVGYKTEALYARASSVEDRIQMLLSKLRK